MNELKIKQMKRTPAFKPRAMLCWGWGPREVRKKGIHL